MHSYNVITFGNFLSTECTEITLRSFRDFYDEVTPKHKKKLNLVIIEDPDHFMDINRQTKDLGIQHVTHVISRFDLKSIEIEMGNASIFVFNDSTKTYKIIPQILSYSLPIVCIDQFNKIENLDHTCGIIVKYRSKESTTIDITEVVKMLYFDREALKVLRKGAKAKYRKEFSWGGTSSSEKVKV
ncbi:MAG: hypothetical protein KJP00_12655 [Bacteroidia bacterium]|nr:hypothetical protein [Bacteroidia bacterium]